MSGFELKPLGEVKTETQLIGARFSPCGAVLAAGGYDRRVHRWKAEESALTPLAPIEGHDGWVSAIGFHPAGRVLYSADSWGRLRAQEFEGEKPAVLWSNDRAHDGWIRGIAVSADHVATCGRDRFVRLWTHDGKPVAAWEGPEDILTVAFHPDGRTVVCGDFKGAVRAWDFGAGKIVREFDGSIFFRLDRLQDVDGLRRLMLIDGGKTLVAAGSQPANGATFQGKPTLMTWSFETGEAGKPVQQGEPKDGHVEDLALHPAGYLLGVTSGVPGNGRIFCWRPGEEQPFFTHTKIANIQSVALHPDGRRLAVTATNRDSGGNGRQVGKDGEYKGNHSPVHLFGLSEP